MITILGADVEVMHGLGVWSKALVAGIEAVHFPPRALHVGLEAAGPHLLEHRIQGSGIKKHNTSPVEWGD